MVYPDTSILIAAVVLEPESERVQAWLSDMVGQLVISDWTITEFASALALQARRGRVSADQRAAGADWFRALGDAVSAILPVNRRSFRRAAEIVSARGLSVRAPDALHLAVAEHNDATLYTLDQDQAAAGKAMGLSALLL